MLGSLHHARPRRLPALWTLALILSLTAAPAQIQQPDDAPPPLSPEESTRQFQLPPGFLIRLVAGEPLLIEPTGVALFDRIELVRDLNALD